MTSKVDFPLTIRVLIQNFIISLYLFCTILSFLISNWKFRSENKTCSDRLSPIARGSEVVTVTLGTNVVLNMVAENPATLLIYSTSRETPYAGSAITKSSDLASFIVSPVWGTVTNLPHFRRGMVRESGRN